LIPENLRPSTRILEDTTVSDTWEEIDASAYVPNGTIGLYGIFRLTTLSSNDSAILCIRSGDSSETNVVRTRFMQISAQFGATNTAMAVVVSFYAINGIFDYRRLSSSHPISNLAFNLFGYYL
jgi:hypothetical protein